MIMKTKTTPQPPGITVNAVAPGIILPAADEDEGKVKLNG